MYPLLQNELFFFISERDIELLWCTYCIYQPFWYLQCIVILHFDKKGNAIIRMMEIFRQENTL